MDDILFGGLPPARMYLIEGDPGTGKTSLGLQFLVQGVSQGERVLHITLAETRTELEDIARSHDWDLAGIEIEELFPTEGPLEADAHYTMFHPSEVELGDSLERIFDRVRDLNPQRIVIDSLSELRLLAGDSLRYRRHLMLFKRFFMDQGITVWLLDDRTGPDGDLQLHSLVNGVISLELQVPEYGPERRRLQIKKLRGRAYSGGFHDFRIVKGGVRIFPRIRPSNKIAESDHSVLHSGIEELDLLLGEGLHRGTSTLLLGPAGVGKTTVASQYALAAAKLGEAVAIFLFDERESTLQKRCRSMGMDLDGRRLFVREFVPSTVTPGEITYQLHQLIEEHGVSVFVLDSLNGYLNVLAGQSYLLVQLHEMLNSLSRAGVTTLMIGAQHGVLGSDLGSPVDASYLVDSLVLFRFFESHGRVRRAISVVKKRSGPHEYTIRELRLHEKGIEVGPALDDFNGVLTGQPTFHGSGRPLL